MKRNLKGSILIWSIFLVIFVSFSFLYVSNQISKSIDRNSQKISGAQVSSVIDNFDFSSKVFGLSDNENLEVKYFGDFSSMLASNDEVNLSFLFSNTGSITLINGGPIYYKVFSGSTVYSSGLVSDNIYDIQLYANTSLYIKNIGGLARFDLEFYSNSGVLYPYNYIFLEKNIGGNDIIKQVFQTK